MEEELDGIESGEIKLVELLSKFYKGSGKRIRINEKENTGITGQKNRSRHNVCEWYWSYDLKTGRFGKYLIVI